MYDLHRCRAPTTCSVICSPCLTILPSNRVLFYPGTICQSLRWGIARIDRIRWVLTLVVCTEGDFGKRNSAADHPTSGERRLWLRPVSKSRTETTQLVEQYVRQRAFFRRSVFVKWKLLKLQNQFYSCVDKCLLVRFVADNSVVPNLGCSAFTCSQSIDSSIEIMLPPYRVYIVVLVCQCMTPILRLYCLVERSTSYRRGVSPSRLPIRSRTPSDLTPQLERLSGNWTHTPTTSFPTVYTLDKTLTSRCTAVKYQSPVSTQNISHLSILSSSLICLSS